MRIPLRDLGIAVVTGALVGLLLAFSSPAAEAGPYTEDNIETLSSSVAAMVADGDRTCTVAKIADSTFVTARHCVTGMTSHDLSIEYKDTPTSYPSSRTITSVRINMKKKVGGKVMDWAVVYTDQDMEDMKPIPLGCSIPVKLGQAVAGMGHPFPMGRLFSQGYISSVSPLVEPYNEYPGSFHADIKAAPGSSGGPVIDAKTGKLIGILISVIVPPSVGRVATGVQGVGITDLCKWPYGATGVNKSAISGENVKPARNIFYDF